MPEIASRRPAARRKAWKSFLYILQEEPTWLTLWSRASGFLDLWDDTFLLFMSLALGVFVTAARANPYSISRRDSLKEAGREGPPQPLDGWPSTHSLNNPIDKEPHFTKPPFYIHYLLLAFEKIIISYTLIKKHSVPLYYLAVESTFESLYATLVNIIKDRFFFL